MSHVASTSASSAPSSTTWASASLAYWFIAAIPYARTASSSCITRTASDAPFAASSSSSSRAPKDSPSTSISCTRSSRKTRSLRGPALTLKMRMRRAYRRSSVSSTQNVSSTSIARITWTFSAASASSHSTATMSASLLTCMKSSACASSSSRTSSRTRSRPGSATRPSSSKRSEQKNSLWRRSCDY